MISGIERISRPGRRVYLGVEDVPTVLGGLGTSILTTSRGVMTGRAARKAGKPTVPATMGLEKKTNPFLRPDVPEIRKSLGMENADTVAVFGEIRARKDKF